MTNPIEAVVAPLKADAIRRAEQEANKIIEHVKTKLEENGWDIDKAAPFPSSLKHSRIQYLAKKSTHDLFHSLVKITKTDYRTYAIVELNKDRTDRFVEVAKEDAAAQYDLFVAKLIGKVGDCSAAQLHGNHVWGYSILEVLKPGHIIEQWKTQQIVNTSKLGRPFNQWPTRKLKA